MDRGTRLMRCEEKRGRESGIGDWRVEIGDWGWDGNSRVVSFIRWRRLKK